MENVMITGHKNPDTDSICSSLSYAFIKKALGEDVTACRAGNVNAETQFVLDYWKVEPPVLVEKVEKDQKVILVDHNEAAQAVDGLEDAEITEIVDHHRLGGLSTAAPLFVRIQPVGCTSTILYQMTVEKNVTLSKEIA